MPNLNGVQAAALLREACPEARVLVLSFHEEPGYLRRLLEAGAAGYVLKRSAASTLVAAIRAVMSGGLYLDPTLAGKLAGAHEGRPAGDVPAAELSEREADVLRLIAQGYSNKEIGVQFGISVKTVETYKARAMQKLGLDSRVAIVRFAAEQGWL
jgi:DNA-binding NarL/FixJ family response regulator